MKNYIKIIALSAVAVNLWSCGSKPATDAGTASSSCIITPELKKHIQLCNAENAFASKELNLTGVVTYDQNHLFTYHSLISGVVTKVTFQLGDYVTKGQVLAEVKTTELTTQKLDRMKSSSELTLAQRKLASVQSLFNDGIASENDLQEAKNNVAIKIAELKHNDEQLAIQGGNITSGIITIKAPGNGYIIEKNITEGIQIEVGQDDLFTLSDLKKIWIQASVYAAQLEKVKVNAPVGITSIAYPDKVFNGKINRLSNVFDSEERVLKAIIELDNTDLLLKPSMMVQVNLKETIKEPALRIPKTAVIFADNTYHLLVYHSDCNVQIVDVEPLSSDDTYYYISEGSITPKEQLINANALLIYNELKEQ